MSPWRSLLIRAEVILPRWPILPLRRNLRVPATAHVKPRLAVGHAVGRSRVTRKTTKAPTSKSAVRTAELIISSMKTNLQVGCAGGSQGDMTEERLAGVGCKTLQQYATPFTDLNDGKSVAFCVYICNSRTTDYVCNRWRPNSEWEKADDANQPG